jgi:tetratricopeptide (TPR) repeat protein
MRQSDLSEKLIIFLSISLLLLFSSCAHMEKEPETGATDTIEIAKNYLTDGDFQKALETYDVAYNQFPNDSELRSNYIRTIHQIKKNADIAFHREDFAQAGSIYRVLLDNYPHFNDLITSSSFDKELLISRINTCSKNLTEKGLLKYREGNLREAISIWNDILKFDPENVEVRKSIDTATVQLKNFQK